MLLLGRSFVTEWLRCSCLIVLAVGLMTVSLCLKIVNYSCLLGVLVTFRISPFDGALRVGG